MGCAIALQSLLPIAHPIPNPATDTQQRPQPQITTGLAIEVTEID